MKNKMAVEKIIGLMVRSIALRQNGRFEESLACLDEALAIDPHFLPALADKGIVLSALTCYEEAVECFDLHLRLAPNLPEVRLMRQNTLNNALDHYDRALQANAADAKALYKKGNILHRLKSHEEAVDNYNRSLVIDWNADTLNNRGNALTDLGRYEDALQSYDQALEVTPDDAMVWFNRGNVLQRLLRMDQAIESYRRAEAFRPDFPEAALELGHCRLAMGDLETGWRLYENRWKTCQMKGTELNSGSPLWLGQEDIAGKTVLLWAEQGYGDVIQFMRYVPLVAERAGRVILRVHPWLRELAKTLKCPLSVITNLDPLPSHDFQCPLMSLPLAMGTQPDSIPSEIPYLAADAVRMENWRAILGRQTVPRVGLVWAGRREAPLNRTRDMRLEALRPLSELDVDLISLQKVVPGEDRQTVESMRRLWSLGGALTDFADTAALIANLDLVISVDTAVAHLAGALGKPVWIMLRRSGEWRWLLDRSDSPWYPTACLFRQAEHGDWSWVVEEITRELAKAFQ